MTGDGVPIRAAHALASLPVTFSFGQARAAGLSRHALQRLVEEADVDRLGRGLYRRADAPLADLDLIAVATRSPRATLCLATALARYGLSDEIPAAADLALPRGSRPPTTRAVARWHFFDRATFDVGRKTFALDPTTSIGLYSAERSIIDAFRTRGSEGPDLAYEALRRWLRQPTTQPSSLLALAQRWPRAVPPLRTAMQVLL